MYISKKNVFALKKKHYLLYYLLHVEMEECGTTTTKAIISKEIIEKSEEVEGVKKEQAQKRVEARVDNNNQPEAIIAPPPPTVALLESCNSNRSISPELPEPPLILPPLEDPSVILTSPEFLPKTKIHSDKSKIYILCRVLVVVHSGKFGIAQCFKICKK